MKKFVAGLAAYLCMSGAIGQNVRMDPAPAESGSLTDRSAPSTYQYDDGMVTSGWGVAGGGEVIGIHKFHAVGGSDLIRSVSAAWRQVSDGTSARVFVWQDDGLGNPNTARLLAAVNVAVANSGTGIMNVYPLPSPVAVSGTFYVGFAVVTSGGQFPLSFHAFPSPPYIRDRSFVGGTGVPPIDPANLSSMPIQAYDTELGYFLLRAEGNGSSFSYQGRLTNAGSNYAGLADVRFTIFDSEIGGAAVSPVFEQHGVAVSAGVFALQIPADPSWFAGAADRYLDVQVRTPGDGETFSPITPRQRISQVPAAMVATVAQSVPWSGVTGAPTIFQPWEAAPTGISYPVGRVGINTPTPESVLEVSGDIGVQNTNSLRARNSSGLLENWMWPRWSNDWMYTNFGNNGWHIRNNSSAEVMTLLPNGFVGIGANPPGFPLHVSSTVGVVTQIESPNTTGTWLNLRNSSAGGTYWRLISTGSENGEGAGKLVIGNGSSPGGNGAVATFLANGRVGIGTSAPDQVLTVNGNASKTGGGSWATLCDPRVKHDIVPMRGTLDRLLSLRGYEYFYNDDAVTSGRALPGRQFGLLADEVERVFPDWVSRDGEGMRMVTERSTTALMVEALRDLRNEKDRQIEIQKREIDAQKGEIENLKARLERLERSMTEKAK